jgi:beta-RFAP synthase
MQISSARLSPPSAVTVDAPARLHLGFIDPNASLGRAFGSVGLTIEGHDTRVTARLADTTAHGPRVEGAASAAQRERIERHLDDLHAAFGGPRVVIDVEQAPRAHTGLGSGTQLALAVGTAFARVAQREASTAELARLLKRGARSGIGIHGFDHGGLIVDGGRASAAGTAHLPPLLSRQPFPDAWRVLLIDDPSREGLHGDDERKSLAALAPFPRTLAAQLSHLVLMQILPGAAEADFDAFATGITEMQRTIGGYFAPAQGGVFSSPAVARALEAVAAEQPAGIGQTSWGPTGFAFLPDARAAQRALATAERAAGGAALVCSIAAGRNRGASWRSGTIRKRGLDAA